MTTKRTARFVPVVIAKLKEKGLTINSPWPDIEAALMGTVSPGFCLRVARELKNVSNK